MVVRLHDVSWSRFAQGLAIGLVREVTPLESNPTRLEVRVLPVEDPRRLDRFLVVSQADAAGEAP
jgi:cell shape-determining protein MreC